VDERSQRIEDRFEWPMVVVALLVIPSILLEESNLGSPWSTVGDVLNWATWLAFVIEAVVMLAVVPKKTVWLRQNPLEVAIVVLTPPVVPAGLQFLRVFRLLRPLRLLRVLRMRVLLSLEGVRDAAVLAAITVIAAGALFARTEEGVTVWEGIWWSMSTVTTVGYGDLVPESTFGKVIAAAVMLVGIGFVALLTAFIADRFVRASGVEEREDRILAKLDSMEARLKRLERQTPGT
jgi:voltage-gated potassium channel